MRPTVILAFVATTYASTLAPLGVFAGTALAQSAPSRHGTALSEDQYVDAVLAHGLDSQVAQSEAALGRAEVAGAGIWPNPSIAWNREASPAGASGTQDIIAASIPLVLSGRLGLDHDAAQQRARAAEARAQSARAQLHHQAVRAFEAVLVAQQRCTVLAASLAQLQTLTQTVEVRERAGAASGYDRLRIDVERAAIENQLRGAQADERLALAEALRLIGPSANEEPTFAGPLVVERPLPRLDVLLAALDTRRADVRALSLEAQAAETARRAASRRWVPDPILSGGVQLVDLGNGSGPKPGYVVGISVPLPFVDRGQGEQARAAAARDLAQTRRAVLLRNARARLVAAFAEAASRREQLVHHREHVLAKTDELRTVAAAAYRGGAAELLVLVDAERAAREAQLTATELASTVVQADTDLLLLSGAYDGAPSERTAR